MIAINTDAEIAGWIPAVATNARKPRRSADRQIPEADAESRSQDYANTVDAVKGSRPSAT